jgi:hypothetical protein
MKLRVFLSAALFGGILAGCGMFDPSGSSTEVNCEDKNSGASVRCPDKAFVIPPPPAEQKKGS